MKVFIERIPEYKSDELDCYFTDVLAQTNLIEELAEKSFVLLKPNLLGTHKPEAAVTTHPAVVESLIRVLKRKGIKNICLGDSAGGTFRIEEVYQVTGMKDVAGRQDIELINFGKEGVEKLEVDGFELLLDALVLKAPAIINIAKYKTHSLTMFTGAVKNLFGTVPGLVKSDYHRLYPDPERLSALMVAIYKKLQPQIVLNVIDGIRGMEGEGPSAGKPRSFGVLFASRSASAVDYAAARMMGLDGNKVLTINPSLEVDGLSPEDIEIPRDWQNFRFPHMKLSRASLYSTFINKIPQSMQRLFYRLYDYYPAFNKKCRLCRICVDSCPVKAISLEEGDATPEIDYNICIKCMCCHEFCPYNAVYIKKTLLAKLLLR